MHRNKVFQVMNFKLYIEIKVSDTNIDKRPVTMEMTFDLCCQSDSLRLLRNSKVYTSVYNPVTEKTVAILLSDSRLILWDVLTTELKVRTSLF